MTLVGMTRICPANGALRSKASRKRPSRSTVTIRGAMPLGVIPWHTVLGRTAAMLVASAAFSIILLWTALRFASFVVPLGVGIAGVLVALSAMITRTDRADYFPWLLQVKVFQSPDPWLYGAIGGVAGAVLAVTMVVAMARHSFR